jgi:hypothetical protein
MHAWTAHLMLMLLVHTQSKQMHVQLCIHVCVLLSEAELDQLAVSSQEKQMFCKYICDRINTLLVYVGGLDLKLQR